MTPQVNPYDGTTVYVPDGYTAVFSPSGVTYVPAGGVRQEARPALFALLGALALVGVVAAYQISRIGKR